MSKELPKVTSIKVVDQQIVVSLLRNQPVVITFYAAQEGVIKVNCNEQIARNYALNRRTQAALKKYAVKQNKKYYRKPISVMPWETLEGEDYLLHY